MPDRPDARNSADNFPAPCQPCQPVPQAPAAGSRPSAELDAVLEKIREALCLDNGEPYEPLPRTPLPREPNADGLIVVDGEGVDPNRPPPMLQGPPPFETE